MNNFEIIVENESNFKFLLLKTNWDNSHINVIKDNNIGGIILSYSEGFTSENIDFLDKIPNLKKISIFSHSVTDFKVFIKLNDLEEIHLDCKSYKNIGFKFPKKIKRVFIEWGKYCDPILDFPNTERLTISKYPFENLKHIKSEKLKDLRIFSKKIISLEGIKKNKEITTIGLFYCPNLKDLSELKDLNKITVLELENCKNISNINFLNNLSQLNELTLINCGDIDSILPLKNLKKLHSLHFYEETNILDGDLKFLTDLKNLKSIKFMNRKHYNIKREYFQLPT